MNDYALSANTDLSIIIVSWNVRELLRRCLASIAASMGGRPAECHRPYEVIVVDNASRDATVEMVRAEFPWVRLIVNVENAGFTRANNQGLRLAGGRYILLLNPDTEVVGDALPAMLAYMDAHPEVGGLGPQLRFPDGRPQSSRRRFPTYATGFIESTPLQRWFPRCRLLRRYYMEDMPDDQPHPVDWLVGACLLLRREAVEAVGLLDERFFMYSEELDYAWRMQMAGWPLVYFPGAVVIHHEAQSSGQVAAERLILFHTSKVQFFSKWFGRRRGDLLRWFLLACFAWEWCVEGVKAMMGHKRPLRLERMRAYARVLRAGLRPASILAPAAASPSVPPDGPAQGGTR